MICKNCGKEMEENEKICKFCGYDHETDTIKPLTPDDPEVSAEIDRMLDMMFDPSLFK